MKRIIILICIAIACMFTIDAAESASIVLNKAVTKLTKAKNVNCSFGISGTNGKISGKFRSSGGKFKLETSAGTTWYDGKNMWTSNPRSKEITLVNPTSQEVNEVNPFAYLSSYKGKYLTGFSKNKEKDAYVILLNPRSSKENFKAVEVTISKKNYMPIKFRVRDRNDQITTIHINSVSLTESNPSGTFTCPVTTMADYELVDLR